jgi:hypothetical protein
VGADERGVAVVPDNDNRPKVLVAIEPRAYRHAIGVVLGDLRPRLDVRVVEPEELVGEAERLGPNLVLCSQPEPHERERFRSWVEFRPYADEPKVKIRIEDRWSVLEDADLDDLLAIVDAAIPSP